MTTAVLTGAGGWFGCALLSLLEDGSMHLPAGDWTVVLGPTDSTSLDQRWSSFATVQRGSLLDPRFSTSLPPADLLVHAAAVIHPPDSPPKTLIARNSFPAFEQNVEMFTAVLHRCTSSATVILLSSSAALGTGVFGQGCSKSGPGLLGYASSKRRCEELLREFCRDRNASGAVIRAFWFYGPNPPERQRRFDRLARSGLFPLVHRGRHLRSVSRADDVARAVVASIPLATQKCPPLFVADATTRNMRELCDARRPAGVRHKVLLPQWVGCLARWCDTWVQRRGGYVQNLHVLGELADPIAIVSTVAVAHRSLLGLTTTDGHYEGITAERS